MQRALVAVLAGLYGLYSVQGVAVRGADGKNSRSFKSTCPGRFAPCSGNGECAETTGTCWCKTGWASTDCSDPAADTYDIKSVKDPLKQDMVGRYNLNPMYMQENIGDPQNMKYIAYDPISLGWTIGKLNSTCQDDICFFAYSKGQPVPPPKGYVFGEPDKHVYYKQLVFDDKDLYPGKEAGYHMSVSYSPDPNALGVTETLSEFTGRYVVQPRYVHKDNGKYAVMPVSLNAPGKKWAILMLTGIGPARRWQMIAEVQDPSLNRYTIPSAGWSKVPPAIPPASSAFGMEMVPSCADHVSMDTCNSLEEQCHKDTGDSKWVQACCRDTCGTCAIAKTSCKLPQTAMGASMLLQMFGKGNSTK